MRLNRDIWNDIAKIKDSLPKKQRILCGYILQNYAQIGDMTVAGLAKSAGVGTTTVMRLVQLLNYDSFAGFKRALTNHSRMQSSAPYQDLKQSFEGEGGNASGEMFQSVMGEACRVLDNLGTPDNLEQFEKAIQLILRSENVYTLGMRSSKAMALYFDYTVERFYPSARQLSHDSDFIWDKVAGHVTPADVLLIFSTYPCTKSTIQIGEFSHEKGIPLILITNTHLNPLIRIADVTINTDSANHLSGNVALFAVIEAFAAELGRRTAPESTEKLEYVERVLIENELMLWNQ